MIKKTNSLFYEEFVKEINHNFLNSQNSPYENLVNFKKLLDPSDEDYALYQTCMDEYAADWVKEITEDTGVDAAAFLERVRELYAGY